MLFQNTKTLLFKTNSKILFKKNVSFKHLFSKPKHPHSKNLQSLTKRLFSDRSQAGSKASRNKIQLYPYLCFLAAGLTYHLSQNEIFLTPNKNIDSNIGDSQYFIDSLCQAASRGDIQYIHLILKKQTVDFNQRHRLGWTPLHAASVNGHHEIVKLLIENGADPNLPDLYKFPTQPTTQQLRLIIQERGNNFSDSIRFNATTSGFTALHYACFNGNDSVIQYLCTHGSDPGIQDDHGWRPVDFLAESHPKAEFLKRLFKVTQEKIEQQKKKEEKELRKKYPLEQQLHKEIVGQVAPINAVASAIRRKENGWHDEERPLVFLFLGSSGVGKTELAKQVAHYLHPDNQECFIRVDMSEFQSKHDVAKFVGSPPGYVGYEEGGQLTEKLSKCPNSVVLLDEVEKAHPDVLTIMLQVFDEGRLTDGKGTTVHCKDAIFIMTSNLAQQEIADEAEALRKEAQLRGQEDNSSKKSENDSFRKESTGRGHILPEIVTVGDPQSRWVVDEGVASTPLSKRFIDTTVYPILRRHFGRDEFLGRISSILYFLPFDDIELERIVELELQRWAQKAKKRHEMDLTWSREVLNELSQGYNLRYGARSIKHEVEARVINPLAKAHELDHLKTGAKIHLALDEHRKIQLHLENNHSDNPDNDPSPLSSFFSM